MTVDARVPYIEYNGNGIITQFDWDWGMHVDSSILCRVDDVAVTNFTVQGMSVVFDTAPADGSDVLVFRSTIIHNPENFRQMGRFSPEKTESAIDRDTYIAQELYPGGIGYEPGGPFGPNDIIAVPHRYDVTIESQRGTDAVLQNWDWDDDPSAGMFAGEVNNADVNPAPADGTVTVHPKGYTWMEYGGTPPLPETGDTLIWWEFEEPTTGNPAPPLLDEVRVNGLKPQNDYTSVTGKIGQAAKLDSATVQNIQQLTGLEVSTLKDQNWSCSIWFQTPSSATGQEDKYIACQWRDNTSSGEGSRKWRLRRNSNADGFQFSIGEGPLVGDFTNLETGNIGTPADTWFHIVLTHDPDADEMTMTVDAGTRFTTAISGGANVGLHDDLAITLGRDLAGDPSTLINGAVDLLAFFSKTLDANEVAGLYNDGDGVQFSDLPVTPPTSTLVNNNVSWFQLDEPLLDRTAINRTNVLADNNNVVGAVGKVLNAAQTSLAGNSYLKASAPHDMQGGERDFTFAIWMQIITTPESPGIVSCRVTNIAADSDWLLIYDIGVPELRFQIGVGAVWKSVADTSIGDLLTGWHLVICQYDSTNDESSIKIDNGTPDTLTPIGTPNTAGGDVYVGRFGAFERFNGRTDEFTFWNRLLTAAELTELWNSGDGITYPGL